MQMLKAAAQWAALIVVGTVILVFGAPLLYALVGILLDWIAGLFRG
jgi:hypothetical protein